MTRSSRTVVVHDPDGVNPYGREVAFAVASGRPVLLHLAHDAEWVPSELSVRTILPGNHGSASRWRQAGSLAHGIGAAARRCAFGRADLLLLWTRSPLEELVFSLLALTGTHVVMVEHNPVSRVRLPVLRRLTMRLLRRTAGAVVVHGPELARQAREALPRATVVECMHPPMSHWWDWASGGRPRAAEGRRSALLLGQVRDDKGITELGPVFAALPERHREHLLVRVCGRRDADASLPQWPGVQVDDRTGPGFLDDAELADVLLSSSILLAPYTGATQSSSVILALWSGLPVLAYRAGELPLVVSDPGLVPLGDPVAFAERLSDFLDGKPVGGPRLDLDEWRRRSERDWVGVMSR